MSTDRSRGGYEVVHVIDSLGRSGGAEQQLIANLHRFTDARLTHRVLCLYDSRGDTRLREVPEGVEVEYLLPHGRRTRNRLILIARMFFYIRQRAPDLLHCALPDAALAARVAGRMCRVPVVESLVNISHELVRTEDNPVVTPTKLAVHRLIDRCSMRAVTRFQALSHRVRDSWIEQVGLAPEDIVVIPRGVEKNDFASGESRLMARTELLAELGLERDSFIILNIGRQVAQKGQIYAVEAMPGVLDRVPTAVLLSAGSSGPATGALRDAVDRLELRDSVRWLGVRQDIPRLMAGSDLFLFPSLYEGLGVSLLEAMASGLACVTTDRGPMTEIVSHEVNGLLVPARDPAAISDAVIRLAGDPSLRAGLGDRALTDVMADHDVDRTARRVERFYLETLNLVSPVV